jgi:hypothetical protein
MQIERDIVRFLIAALTVAALYNILSPTVGGGKSGASVQLTSTTFKGLGGIFARVTGQSPPAGY